jgi:hypothetical protein
MNNKWNFATKRNVKLYRLECILDKGYDPGPPRLLIWRQSKRSPGMIEGYDGLGLFVMVAFVVIAIEFITFSVLLIKGLS